MPPPPARQKPEQSDIEMTERWSDNNRMLGCWTYVPPIMCCAFAQVPAAMLRPLAAMVLVLLTVSTAARQHDCLIGTPLCNNSLASDKSCRGVYSSDINAWHRKDCDCECLQRWFRI